MTEDQLREQMHRIDELSPPGTAFEDHAFEDHAFEDRALYAGQRRLARRRAWSRGLAGAAAAVVIGALALPVLTRQPDGVSTAAAPERRGAAAPTGPASAGTTGAGSDLAGTATGLPWAAGEPAAGVPGRVGEQGVASALALVTAALQRPPYDEIYTAVRPASAPGDPVRFYLTRLDPAATALVTAGLPAGTPITFLTSAYSAAACASTLARVGADLPTLAPDGIPLAGTGCDELGRVSIVLGRGATAGQRSAHQFRYGDRVTVGQETSSGAPSGATPGG